MFSGKKRNTLLPQMLVLLLIFTLVLPLKSFASSDVTPPQLNSFSISTTQATVGDTVKITADILENGSGLNYAYIRYNAPEGTASKYVYLYYNSATSKYEGGFQVNKNDAPGTWVVDYIWLRDNQDNYYYYQNAQGSYKGNNYEYKDLNQYNIQVTGTIADITPPSLSSLNISTSKATADDTVKITADIKEEGSGLNYAYIRYNTPEGTASKYVYLYYNSATSKYEGSFQVGKYDAPGTWVVDYIWLRDNQDNYYYYQNAQGSYKGSNYEYRDLNQYNIQVANSQYDSTPPKLNDFNISTNQVKIGDTVKVSADITELGSGLNYAYVRYTAPAGTASKYVYLYYNSQTSKYEGTFTTGKYDALGTWVIDYIWLRDNQDNYYYYQNAQSSYKGSNYEYKDLSQYSIVVGEADQVAPNTTIQVDTSIPKKGDWFSSSVNVSLNATDDSSGVEKTFYRINGGDWTQYTAAFEIQNEGVTTIEYKSVDKAGNEEAVNSETVEIDKVKPTTTISNLPENWTSQNVNVTLTGSDEVSGVASTLYRINGGDWTTYQVPFTISQQGVNTIEYKSNDNAGNTEDVKSATVKIDQTAPVTSVSPVKDGWYNTDVKLNLTSQDALSGVNKKEYRVNGGDWVDYNNEIVVSSEGINKVEYRSVDNAGNIEKAKSVEVKIDKTNPTLDFYFDLAVITNRNHKLMPVKATVNANDSLSGIASFELVSIVSSQADNGTGDGNTTQDIQGLESGTADTDFLVRAETTGSQNRIYTVTYKAIDNAGNYVVVSKGIVVKGNNEKN